MFTNLEILYVSRNYHYTFLLETKSLPFSKKLLSDHASLKQFSNNIKSVQWKALFEKTHLTTQFPLFL